MILNSIPSKRTPVPPFHVYFSLLSLPLTSLSLSPVFSSSRGGMANVLSPDMTEFHGLSGRFSTKEGKFCEIVLARGTKEINSVARAGPRVWDDDAFKAQASLPSLCALNTRSSLSSSLLSKYIPFRKCNSIKSVY